MSTMLIAATVSLALSTASVGGSSILALLAALFVFEVKMENVFCILLVF